MIFSLFTTLLALLALSFLIFIHELGHYWMARRVGMRVETFSIGFGKPIYSWERNGVKWQIGWLFFGGYVKIAGQDPDDERDPYEIEDGFFGKSPWDRIKVAFAGPFVNLLFALLFFTALWMVGGRVKNFSEYTPKIGWIDEQSELYSRGLRPGDEIVAYGDRPFQSAKDHYNSILMSGDDKIDVDVKKVNYATGDKKEETIEAALYPHPFVLEEGIRTAGILSPASYLIYDDHANDEENPLIEKSSIKKSGLKPGDRLLWADGEMLFSLQQLEKLLNDDRVFLTISRDGKLLHRRVPRVQILELRLDPEYREELADWQYEGELTKSRLRDLYTIPYNLTDSGVVEARVPFIDRDGEEEAFPETPFSSIEEPLEVGDKIVAINDQRIVKAYELIQQLQTRRATIIVERGVDFSEPIETERATQEFDEQVDWSALNTIVSSIGSDTPVKEADNLHLLETITPKRIDEFALSPEAKALRANALLERRKQIDEIRDPEKRTLALNNLEKQENRLFLGIPQMQDRKVRYNPAPQKLFIEIVEEIGHTLTALFSGSLNPKWMSGPVGIIHIAQNQSFVSIKETLYWMGLFSLNLGILNLLPIPVLDGGTILISFYEMITRKRLKQKTMERLILPFALLLIAFLIYVTYNDVARIVTSLLQ